VFVATFGVCVTVLLFICNYFQELKNKWRSAEELRKTDNGHREKNSWKQKQKLDGDYEPKCNIQKGNREIHSFNVRFTLHWNMCMKICASIIILLLLLLFHYLLYAHVHT
jgi:hypothetical protein